MLLTRPRISGCARICLHKHSNTHAPKILKQIYHIIKIYQILPDKTEIYFYAEASTTQITIPNGQSVGFSFCWGFRFFLPALILSCSFSLPTKNPKNKIKPFQTRKTGEHFHFWCKKKKWCTTKHKWGLEPFACLDPASQTSPANSLSHNSSALNDKSDLSVLQQPD